MTEPFSELFWEYLLGRIADGRVVPVVGQDLLVVEHEGRSITLYELLAERLAAKLLPPEVIAKLPVEVVAKLPAKVIAKLPAEVAAKLPAEVAGAQGQPGTLSAVAAAFLAAQGELQYIYSALNSVMPDPAALPVPPPLLKLASIPYFKLFVTTTFDSLLERALRSARSEVAAPAVLGFFPENIQDLPKDWALHPGATIYQLLGRLSKAPFYAVTEEDTLEFIHALQSKERRPEQLFKELTDRDLLLLGNSFPDWLARFFIRIGRPERLSAAPASGSDRYKRDIIADSKANGDPGLVLFLSHYSSQVRVYPNGGAAEFVEELHRRWNAAPATIRQPGIAPTPQMQDAEGGKVFISYAREDVEAAQAIYAALEAEKIPAWIDDSDIRAGDQYEDTIKKAILAALLFVPVISQHTLANNAPRTFRAEWEYAIQRAPYFKPRNFILPVGIDTTPENHEDLPVEFRSIHWLRPPEGRPDSRLVDEIRQAFRGAQ